MVNFIESELSLLKREISEMGALVASQLERAGEAMLTFNKELAQQILVREKRVNAFELKIDSDVEDVISLYNPVAIDLRFVLAVLKINANLERLGDFAAGMARFVCLTNSEQYEADLLQQLPLKEMHTEVCEMLRQVEKAWEEESMERATTVFAKDRILDEGYAKATDFLAAYLQTHPASARFCLDLNGVFRKLERSGDHITNMAEEIVFFVDAKVLKHSGTSAENVSEEKNV